MIHQNRRKELLSKLDDNAVVLLALTANKKGTVMLTTLFVLIAAFGILRALLSLMQLLFFLKIITAYF